MKICLSSPAWTRHGTTWCRGYAIVEHRCLEGDALACYFDEADTIAILLQKLKEANGMFAVVKDWGHRVAMAVDRVRSVPLFFSSGGPLAISDTPYAVAPLPAQRDLASLCWYRASGAVLPGQTLDRRLRQVPAGVLLEVETSTSRLSSIRRYCSFLCREEEASTATTDDLSTAVEHAFANLDSSVAGHPLVVPLSGGYDSRLIACLLKEHGHNNVICFNVGTPGSHEHQTAERVATRLGYEYHFVDVSKHEVFSPDVLRSEDFRRYSLYLGGYTNFEWLFEYVAMRHLLRQQVVGVDAIVVPGHSGDFLAGSHLAKGGVDNRCSARQLALDMAYRSFEGRSNRKVLRQLHCLFAQKISEGYMPASVYEDFIMSHRQAHQIVNSSRVYNYLGMQTRLPLWDDELIQFFRCLDQGQRKHCQLYLEYVHGVFRHHGVDYLRYGGDAPKPAASLARRWAMQLLPSALVHRLRHTTSQTGEPLLAQPLYDELSSLGYYSFWHQPLSSNQIISDWYLCSCSSASGPCDGSTTDSDGYPTAE